MAVGFPTVTLPLSTTVSEALLFKFCTSSEDESEDEVAPTMWSDADSGVVPVPIPILFMYASCQYELGVPKRAVLVVAGIIVP